MTKLPGTPDQLKARRVFVDALRSGKYTQTQGHLNRTKEYKVSGTSTIIPPGMCCLGVACDVSGLGHWALAEHKEGYRMFITPTEDSFNVLPEEVMQWLGFTSGGRLEEEGYELWELNDHRGMTFLQIADYVEEHAEVAPAGEVA